jgi:hypothetical protein
VSFGWVLIKSMLPNVLQCERLFVISRDTGRVHCWEVVARLAWTSGRGGRVEGQLKQRVHFTGVLFGNEHSSYVERLHVELFVKGLISMCV